MILEDVHDLAARPLRIVSLVPSLTELLSYLGLATETIAVTKFCIHPKAWQKSKAIIGGTKNVHIAQIKALNPDLIIANKEENVKEQVEELALDYPVWLTDVNDMAGAMQMINDVGRLLHREEKAAQIIKGVRENFGGIVQLKNQVRTAYTIWNEPMMVAGGDTFINDMLNHCGLQNIFASLKRYPEVTIADLQEANCELLLLSSEPYPFKQLHIDKLQPLLPGTNMILCDGEFFSWYGSRLLHAPAYFNTLLAFINRPGSSLKA